MFLMLVYIDNMFFFVMLNYHLDRHLDFAAVM